MLDAIIEVLRIMGWLGITLAILVITNTATGTLVNMWQNQETFSWKKLLKGIIKAVIFYGSKYMHSSLNFLISINIISKFLMM